MRAPNMIRSTLSVSSSGLQVVLFVLGNQDVIGVDATPCSRRRLISGVMVVHTFQLIETIQWERLRLKVVGERYRIAFESSKGKKKVLL